jgi:hypothetical protein
MPSRHYVSTLVPPLSAVSSLQPSVFAGLVSLLLNCLLKPRHSTNKYGSYVHDNASLQDKRNISMDTLITPVFLRCMVTNGWKVSVSIVAGSVKEGKTIPEVLVSASRPPKLVFTSLSPEAEESSARSELKKVEASV